MFNRAIAGLHAPIARAIWCATMARKSNITMAGIAELAGVSISTVSRALADNPAIAKTTRDQIKSLAKAHGFAPNLLARGLRRQRTDTVGVIIPLGHQRDQHLTDPFMMTMIGHIADALCDQGMAMLLRRIVPENDDWLEMLTRSARVDGLIILGQSDQHHTLNRAAADYATMVVWGGHLPDSRYVTVGTDNRLGGRLAARHLIEQGRRKLLLLGQSAAPEFSLREKGFREECAKHPDVEVEFMSVPLVPEAAHAHLTEQLGTLRNPDGIFGLSDVIAFAAVDVLERAGRSVPVDVSVIGYDNVVYAGFGGRPLTTIDQHIGRSAHDLASTIRAAIEGKPISSSVIDPTLVIGATSRAGSSA